MDLDSYFDELMCIATNADLVISVDTMHQYVASLATLNTMMHMLLDELDNGVRAVYLNAIEARVFFHNDVTTEYADTIADYHYWHQFTIVDHHEDVEELVLP